MARCTNEKLISKIGMKSLSKTTEVSFAVMTDIDSCVKVNTKNYIDYLGTSATYNAFKVPADMFSCLPEGCKNSGTLVVTNGAGLVSGATFVIRADATEFATGVITYYAYFPTAGKYDLKSVISDIADTNQSNAYTYENTFEAQNEGFYPVVIDLSKVPSTQTGTGWQAMDGGIIIHLEAAGVGSDNSVIPTIGFSSIYVYDSIEDFEVNDTVMVGCLDEVSGDITADPRDASCFGGGYDPSSVAVEKTITGKSATPNYWKLNPLVRKGDLTTGWIPQTVEKTVGAITVEGISYGYVQLSDMNLDECGFLLATIADNCNVADAMLNRLNSPVPLTLNEKQYIVLDGTTTAMGDAGKILFHETLAGQNVVISYPKQVEVEHFVGNDSALEGRKTRMTITKEQTDGVKIVQVHNNVLVTSFPDSITNEETTFPFTISIQRDRNGNFFEIYRVKE